MPDPRNVSPPGLRQASFRAGVFLDVAPVVAHDTHAASADTPTDVPGSRAASNWGDPIDVRGRDTVEVMLTFTKVSGQTGLTVAMQSSWGDAGNGVDWFDRYTTLDLLHGNSVTIPTAPREPALDVSGFADGEHRIVIEVRTLGLHMRFKPYGAGTLTGSRCKIECIRVMESS